MVSLRNAIYLITVVFFAYANWDKIIYEMTNSELYNL